MSRYPEPALHRNPTRFERAACITAWVVWPVIFWSLVAGVALSAWGW